MFDRNVLLCSPTINLTCRPCPWPGGSRKITELCVCETTENGPNVWLNGPVVLSSPINSIIAPDVPKLVPLIWYKSPPIVGAYILLDWEGLLWFFLSSNLDIRTTDVIFGGSYANVTELPELVWPTAFTTTSKFVPCPSSISHVIEVCVYEITRQLEANKQQLQVLSKHPQPGFSLQQGEAVQPNPVVQAGFNAALHSLQPDFLRLSICTCKTALPRPLNTPKFLPVIVIIVLPTVSEVAGETWTTFGASYSNQPNFCPNPLPELHWEASDFQPVTSSMTSPPIERESTWSVPSPSGTFITTLSCFVTFVHTSP